VDCPGAARLALLAWGELGSGGQSLVRLPWVELVADCLCCLRWTPSATLRFMRHHDIGCPTRRGFRRVGATNVDPLFNLRIPSPTRRAIARVPVLTITNKIGPPGPETWDRRVVHLVLLRGGSHLSPIFTSVPDFQRTKRQGRTRRLQTQAPSLRSLIPFFLDGMESKTWLPHPRERHC
jgi:hypothetical protein